jgi:D-beta-D-heptose 7-phosphate kinase / D-beta-D-heptose 1-phosphate adenosyltransferase
MTADKKKLARTVNAMRGRRIAVVGDWMLDRYTWGATARLSPEAPVPIVDFASQSECLGGAGNVAANLAALGAHVTPFGVIGKDADGAAVARCAAAAGMRPAGILTDSSRITTTKTRIIARHQQIVRVDHERREPLSKNLEEKLIRAIKASLNAIDALVLSDYDKGVVTDALADRVLEFCRKSGVPAFVKPKTSRLFAYRGATSIVCNSKEAGFFVTRALNDAASIEQAGRALLAHFGCASVVITMGEKGLSLFEESSPRHVHIPATSFEVSFARFGKPGVDREANGRQVFDVTGAGDTVLATLSLAVASGAPLADAAMLANLAAGVVVGKLGTSSVEPAELLAAVQELR